MNEDAQEFLKECGEYAERTIEEDRDNESNIMKFWNFQETINTVGQAIRKAVIDSDGAPSLDMQKYYDALEETQILKVDRNHFTRQQIETIAKSSFPSYIFAIYVCKGRFLEGEDAIQRNLKLWAEYEYVCNTYFDEAQIQDLIKRRTSRK